MLVVQTDGLHLWSEQKSSSSCSISLNIYQIKIILLIPRGRILSAHLWIFYFDWSSRAKQSLKKQDKLKQVCLFYLCLDQGHPVNPRDYCGWTPLHEACNHGHHGNGHFRPSFQTMPLSCCSRLFFAATCVSVVAQMWSPCCWSAALTSTTPVAPCARGWPPCMTPSHVAICRLQDCWWSGGLLSRYATPRCVKNNYNMFNI